MADKLIYIPNDYTQITSFLDLIYCLKRLNTQLDKPTNRNSEKKSPKMLSQIRKRYYKSLGTSVINSPLSPLSLQVMKKSPLFQ